jgi:hypothetical protein
MPTEATEQEIVQALLDAGYAEWKTPPISHADRWFQRRVMLDRHTLYFLNIGLYDHRRHGVDFGPCYGLQLDADLYHPQWPESGVETAIGVPPSAEGITGAEAMIATLFTAGGFEPDRHNNDDLDGARRALAEAQAKGVSGGG